MEDRAVDQDLDILDFSRGLTDAQKAKLVPIHTVPSELIESAWKDFEDAGKHGASTGQGSSNLPSSCTVYEHKDFPGTISSSYIMLPLSSPRPKTSPLSSHRKSKSFSSPLCYIATSPIPNTKPISTTITRFPTLHPYQAHLTKDNPSSPFRLTPKPRCSPRSTHYRIINPST